MWSQIISSILFSRCSIWIKYQPNPGYGNLPEALDFAYSNSKCVIRTRPFHFPSSFLLRGLGAVGRERERPLSPSSSCSRFSEGHLLIRGLSYTTSAKLWIFLGVILTYSTNLKGFLTPPILCRRHIWKLPHPRRISHGNGRLNSVGPWVGLTPACKQEIWIMGQIDDKHIFALKGMF